MPLGPQDRVPFTCGNCGRSLTLPLQTLLKRRICSYCGKPLQIPAEVEQALAQLNPKAAAHAAAQALSIECPICGRNSRVKAVPGSRSKCMFCGCHFLVPQGGGLAAPSPPDELIPKLDEGDLLLANCPACKQISLKASNRMATEAICGGCQAKVDCRRIPLEAFTDLMPGIERATIVQLAREALRARWQKGELGLMEAINLFEPLEQIDAWAKTPNAPISPYTPEMTADIVQWAILYEPQANRVRDGESFSLECDIADEVSDKALTVEGVLKGTAGELKAASSRMRRAFTTGLAGEDRARLRLDFFPVEGGTDATLSVRHTVPRDPKREPEEARKEAQADADMVEWLTGSIRAAMPDAARQYLAFKAVFGIWVSGSMFNAATEKGALHRLELLGAPFAKNAAETAKLLTQRRKLGE